MTGPMTGDDQYAGVVSRGLALGTDAAIVVTLVLAGVATAQVVGSAIGIAPRSLADALTPVLLASPPIVLIAYNTVFWSLTGRTPAMALFGVRVVRTRGRPMKWGWALVRALVLGLAVWGALWSLVDSRRQALHDKLAGTVVIYDPARPSASPVTDEDRTGDGVSVLPPPPRVRSA
jgi:uncharacterized RDD family membrane protein YckC